MFEKEKKKAGTKIIDEMVVICCYRLEMRPKDFSHLPYHHQVHDREKQ